MKYARLLLPFTLLLLLSAAFLVGATCVPGDTGTAGDDTIICDVVNQPVGNVSGGDGNDTINIGAGVATPITISGDAIGASIPGSGTDTITNDGTVSNIFGDATSGNGSGNDTITNNGTVTGLVSGDAFNGTGSGNDVITNNGTIGGGVLGDTNNVVGSGADYIANNGTIVGDVMGDSSIGAGSGNDVIANNGTVNGSVYGDSQNQTGTGSDVLINNGTVNGNVAGEGNTGNGLGNDTIVNNGFVGGHLVGDTVNVTSSGSDSIINNGTVVGDISGDSRTSDGTGADSILNNGAATDIFGDARFGSIATGDDLIVNNGTADNIYGDNVFATGTGNDTIVNGGNVNGDIIAAGGSDTVIIQGNTATVGGTIDGGAGYDLLTFNLTSSNPDEIISWAEQIAAANPAGGTLILGGHSFTWTNFEELTQLLFTLARINGNADPLAVFCAFGGGIDVYTISGAQGILALTVNAQTISTGLALAAQDGSTLQIGGAAGAVVYVTPTGDVQVNAPNGFSFSFTYQNFCGRLPAPGESLELVQAEEELPGFTIINRPR